MEILIMALVSLFVGTVLYGSKFFGILGFAKILKSFSTPKSEGGRGEIFGFKPRENKSTQLVLADKHKKFVFFAKGWSFAIEKDRNATFAHERDKWWIVENLNYDYIKAHLEGGDPLRLWAFSELGIYLYRNAFPFQQRPRYRKLNISKIVDGKLVPILPHESKFFFHTTVVYGMQVIEVEDSTGNPVTVVFGIPSIGVNPYIANVEIEAWDEMMNMVATKAAYNVITSEPFLLANDKFNAAMQGLTGDKKPESMKNEIAERFNNEVLSALKHINMKEVDGVWVIDDPNKPLGIGFDFQEVAIYNVIPSAKVADSVFKLYDAVNEALANVKKAEGVKALEKAAIEGFIEALKTEPSLAPYVAIAKSNITTLVGFNEFISQLKKGGI